VSDDFVFLALPDAGHEQKTSFDSGAAKSQCFFGTGDSKPGSAFGLEGLGTGGSAVSVGVGFDYGADADAFAHVFPHRVKVWRRAERETSAQFGLVTAGERSRRGAFTVPIITSAADLTRKTDRKDHLTRYLRYLSPTLPHGYHWGSGGGVS